MILLAWKGWGPLVIVIIAAIFGGCAIIARSHFDDMFGRMVPQQRMVNVDSNQGLFYQQKVLHFLYMQNIHSSKYCTTSCLNSIIF